MIRLRTLGRGVCLLALGLMVVGCASARVQELENDLQDRDDTIAALQNRLNDINSENSNLRNRLATTELQRANVQDQLEAQTQLSVELQRKLEEFIQNREGVSMPQMGQLTFTGDLFFKAGLAELTKEAEDTLTELAGILTGEENVKLSIQGHTDNDPIVKTAYLWKTRSNFELSAARALKVLLFLEQNGIPAERMHMISFGEFEPKVPNDSKESKALNRRVELFLVPATIFGANGDEH